MSFKFTLFTACFILISLFALADIIPNPVKAKGIVPVKTPVEIQLQSEVVTADLYKDSAFVECVFYMQNWGKSMDMQIGFPIMNFDLWGNNKQDPNASLQKGVTNNMFTVQVGSKTVKNIGLYIPPNLYGTQRPTVEEAYELHRTNENRNKPWYLWQAHFKEKETVKIIVRYRLPAGEVKWNRFFNYILSTGAGWKGKIEKAKIVVNLKDIPADQIIDVSPAKHYKRKGQQFIWNFKNLEPTINDDILVRYETKKGEYKAFLAKRPSFYIDGVRYNADDKPAALKIKGASVHFKQPDAIDKNGANIFYTVDYALRKFKDNISSYAAVTKAIKPETAHSLPLHYRLEINGDSIPVYRMFNQMLVINNMQVTHAEVVNVAAKHKIIKLKVTGWAKPYKDHHRK